MRKFVLVIIILFSAVSCSRKNNYENIPGKDLLNELDSKIFTTFNKPMDQLIEQNGEPDKIDTTSVANKHTGYEDHIYTLYYDDYDLDIYHSLELDKFLLQSVEFKSDEILNDYSIRFGMSKEDFNFLAPRKVKETEKQDQIEIIYSAGSDPGYESLFVFSFKDNSLYQVKYNAPID